MAIILSRNSKGFGLKTKSASLDISRSQIKINNFQITNRGEYDVSDVACDIHEIDGHISTLIESEMVLFGILDADFDPNDIEEDYSQVSVLLLFVDKAEDLTKGARLVGQVEPQLVFYFSENQEVLSSIPNLEQVSNSYKISKSDLSFEGTRHISIV